MGLLHLYRSPGLTPARREALLQTVRQRIAPHIEDISTEFCFNIDAAHELAADQLLVLTWLLGETFEPNRIGPESFLEAGGVLLEVGPRMNFSTAWSTNAVSICHACGLDEIRRIERSRRYLLKTTSKLTENERSAFLAEVHDRMTECVYPKRLTNFETGIEPEPTFNVPVMKEGRAALERINREMGLSQMTIQDSLQAVRFDMAAGTIDGTTLDNVDFLNNASRGIEVHNASTPGERRNLSHPSLVPFRTASVMIRPIQKSAR